MQRKIHADVPGRTDCRMRDLHENLQRRLHKEIPVSEVARAINVDKRALEKWYNNELDVFHGAILAALCYYYDCEVGELLTTTYTPSDDTEGQHWPGRQVVATNRAGIGR